jgi:ribosome maturation factor RimP
VTDTGTQWNGPYGPFLLVASSQRRGSEYADGMGQAVDKEHLLAILEPSLAAMGYELADIDVHLGRRGLLRLYIDREGGVTIDDCQRVSEQVGALLDVEDPLPSSYVLEVSSPGFDRRLRKLAHFERFSGERAKVELRDARDDGRRNFTGRLVGVEGSTVLLDVDGELTRLPFDDIAVARLAP